MDKFKQKNPNKFVLKMLKFLKEENLLKNFLDYEKRPDKFNLENFKVFKCTGFCGKDSHICYYYHNEYERRRHPLLFNFSGDICKKKILSHPRDINNFTECPNVK